MKKAVVFIFSVCVGLSYGDWEKYNWNFVSTSVRSMQFIDAQYGWISTAIDDIRHTSDSGKTWTNLKSGEDWLNTPINDFYFSDKNNGWISALATYNTVLHIPDTIGRVYNTTDGGKSWSLVYSDSSWYDRSSKIFFPTPQVGYFVANAYGSDNRRNSVRIGKTTDGGINWTTNNIEDFTLRDAGFVNADTGWISGLSSTASGFFRTVDGGNTWEFKEFKPPIPTSTYNFQLPEYITLSVLNGKKAWVNGVVKPSSGFLDFLAITNDFGDSWDTLWTHREIIGVPNMIRPNFSKKIHFLNDTVGFAIGGAAITSLIFTLDGGRTWDYHKDPVFNFGADMVYFVDSCHGWVYNSYGEIFRTTNAGGLLEHVSVKSISPKKQNAVSSFAIKQSSSKKGISNINYTLSTESSLSLSIYNLKGTRIAFAPERTRAAGAHSFSFKAPKGFYIVEARVKNKSGQGETKFTERIFVR